MTQEAQENTHFLRYKYNNVAIHTFLQMEYM